MRILEGLENRGKPFIVFFGYIQIAILGLANFLTGFELSFSFFYLIPVAMVAWYAGKTPGLAVAFSSAVVWQFANFQAGQTFSHTFVPIWNSGTRLGFFLVVAFLLIKLKKSLLDERRQARTDYLTGAENPRSFYEKAENELARTRRYRRDLSIAYLDADNFKNINDTLGHQVGSDLLIKLVEVMKNNLRSTDIVARIGGDEFVILLPETTLEQARTVINKIRESIAVEMTERNWNVTFSIGVLTCKVIPESVDELIKSTDSLMYEVKKSGKNSVRFEMFNSQIESKVFSPAEVIKEVHHDFE